MEVAKITSKGQITIPIDIRKKMNLQDGSKVLFFEKDGKYYIENAAFFNAASHMQEAFKGEAERLNLNTEEDVVSMVKEIRRELWEERQNNESNG